MLDGPYSISECDSGLYSKDIGADVSSVLRRFSWK